MLAAHRILPRCLAVLFHGKVGVRLFERYGSATRKILRIYVAVAHRIAVVWNSAAVAPTNDDSAAIANGDKRTYLLGKTLQACAFRRFSLITCFF